MGITNENLGFLFLFINFALGTVVGSFLNVIIYRLPRNESIVKPPSHCTNCGTKLGWIDNIPILSYIFLKGRCRYCGAKISVKYPLIETFAGFVSLLIGLKTGWSFDFLFYIIFASLLIAVAFIDLFEGVVPDALVIPGTVLGIFFNVVHGKNTLFNSLIGIAIAFVIFGLIILLSKGGMGQGDLTLSLMIGSFLGWKFTLLAFVLAFIFGAVGGIIALAFRKKNRKDSIPFGPYMALSTFLVLVYGNQILNLYFKVLHF